MSNDDWIKQFAAFEKTHEIVRKIVIESSKGLVLRFKDFLEAEYFEEKYLSKAWGNGVCCNINKKSKIYDHAESTKNLDLFPVGEKINLYSYVVVFEQVKRDDLLKLVENLTEDFNKQELVEINKLFSKLDWIAIRHVGDGDRFLRIGVDANSLNKSQLEDLIAGYQNLMGELFPEVKKLSTRQVMAILKASQSFYFADLGT